MADFDEDFLESPRFPDCISQGSIGGPGFLTEIVIQNSGVEKRTKKWSQRRGQYNAAYGARTMPDVEELIAFCHVLRGRAIGFRFKDWSDYKSCSVLDTPAMDDQELVRVSAGVYQLVKVYDLMGATYTRDIVKPVDGTVLIAAGGVLQVEDTDYEIDYTSGRVTFFTDPEDESPQVFDITGGFEFDVPCRFDIDELPINMRTKEIMGMDIPLVELKLPPPAEIPYITTAKELDGTNDWFDRGGTLTGSVNYTKFVFSAFINVSDLAADYLYFVNTFPGGPSGGLQIFLDGTDGPADNVIGLLAVDADGVTPLFYCDGNTSITAGWHHIIMSVDTADVAGTLQIAVDGVLQTLTDVFAVPKTNGTIDGTAVAFLAGSNGAVGADLFDGCWSEYFYHQGIRLDISVPANVRKFRKINGKPEDLGANGEIPLGVQPLVYSPSGDLFNDQRGTGGALTPVGAVTDCPDSPSD